MKVIAPPAKLLVIGATGSIGRLVVAEALREGYRVRALVRDRAKAQRVLPWSTELFHCESLLLHSHWVLVVMDVFTRRIVSFGVERASIDGVSVCRMFNRAIAGERLPKHLSTDHDPLFRFHRWLANLRVLEIDEISRFRTPRSLIPSSSA